MKTGRVIPKDVYAAGATAQEILAAATDEATAMRVAAQAELTRANAAGARHEKMSDDARVRGSASEVGALTEVTGVALRARIQGAELGEVVWIDRRDAAIPAEVVGFRGDEAMLLALGDLQGLAAHCPVWRSGGPLRICAGEWMRGQVLDGLGRPLDGSPLPSEPTWIVNRPAPSPLDRTAIDTVLATGIRAIDGLLTLGRGQRIGVFAGAGVGKSTLLAQLAQSAAADVCVVAVIGERGREVTALREGPLALRRDHTVTVCATSADPCMVRVRAASTATAIAEYFRDQGAHVLLVLDSITRVARAQREVGLAAGEPAGRHGYPPSTFALLPALVERAGTTTRGSITAIYSVLVAGDDLDEPIADEMRGLLDGHIVLDRRYAARGHFPAIDVPASVSRLMPDLVSAEHAKAASRARRLLATYEESRDLIALGAYKPGANRELDLAVSLRAPLDRLLQQGRDGAAEFTTTVADLVRVTTPTS